MIKQKRGQVWVETVIYTLIAFSLIALILAFMVPRIEQIQDKGVIERSIVALEDIDAIINGIGGPGNQRVIELGIRKGSFNIDGINDTLYFYIESRHAYSEPDQEVVVGRVSSTTKEVGELYDVNLKIDYQEIYNITYSGASILETISESPTPYTLIIANTGEDSLNRTIINMEVVS